MDAQHKLSMPFTEMDSAEEVFAMAAAMAGWLSILQFLASVGIVVVAFGLMFGMLKPSDALKHIGAILGIVIVLMLLPGIVVSAWRAIPVWQRFGLGALLVLVWITRAELRKHRGRRSRD